MPNSEYADDEARAIVRPILDWPTDKRGMFTQPTVDDWKARRDENAARQRAAVHGFYADPWIGVGKMFDPSGKYLCVDCNMAEGTECVAGDMLRIVPMAGGCKHWERICAGDPEPRLKLPWLGMAYGVSVAGGWGCDRCEHATLSAVGPDDMGRSLWCGWWHCRVLDKACCEFQESPTLELDDDGVPVKSATRTR